MSEENNNEHELKSLDLDFGEILKIIEADFGDYRKAYKIEKYIKQRIKAVCEFYLRYKDKPALFSDEQFTIDWKYDRLTGTYIVELGNRYTEYNYWLFKLAFKNILDEELKVYNE